MAYLLKNSKEKNQSTQKSGICFNAFKSWKTINLQKEPCQKKKKKKGNFTITVSNI